MKPSSTIGLNTMALALTHSTLVPEHQDEAENELVWGLESPGGNLTSQQYRYRRPMLRAVQQGRETLAMTGKAL